MERMRELVSLLNEAARRYYEQDNPVMSDKEYDALYDEPVGLELETGDRLPDSPTRRVGGAPQVMFEAHTHLARLWSRDKVQSFEGLFTWMQRMQKLRDAAVADGVPLPPLSYFVEFKFDGLGINLTYENGALVCAASRGNGIVGETITDQVKTIHAIPRKIAYQGRMEAYGEGYMRLSTLKAYNESTDGEPLKNARNAAAGALRNIDPEVTRRRSLDAFIYGVGYIEGKRLNSAAEVNDFLKDNGFPVCDQYFEADTVEGVCEAIKAVEAQRAGLDYLIDGAVVSVNDAATREIFGYTDKFPRWSVAYKFEAEEVTTQLLGVTWEVGRTGKLTPLAHLEPVDIAGATIRRATLNNIGDIRRKRLSVGCRVWLRRSNEVIPEVLGRVDTAAEGAIEPPDEAIEIPDGAIERPDGAIEPPDGAIGPPDRCPACGAETLERGAHLFCPNRRDCMPQIVARMAHYASRDAMDIDSLSTKTIAQLHMALGVSEPSDLYALERDQLIKLERFGEKKADNLLAALEGSKKPALDAFLFAIGIPEVGRKTARDLALRFPDIHALMDVDALALATIPSVGDVVAGNIALFFADAANRAQVDALLSVGIEPRQIKLNAEGVLSGKTVVVTGTLSRMSRAQAEQAIVNAGGAASGSVSARTSLVVAGESAGSKLAKAEKLGVPVIDEAQFREMLGLD